MYIHIYIYTYVHVFAHAQIGKRAMVKKSGKRSPSDCFGACKANAHATQKYTMLAELVSAGSHTCSKLDNMTRLLTQRWSQRKLS